jgi:hypothetical protein
VGPGGGGLAVEGDLLVAAAGELGEVVCGDDGVVVHAERHVTVALEVLLGDRPDAEGAVPGPARRSGDGLAGLLT